MPKGVKFKPEREEMEEAIERYSGRLDAVARHFKVGYQAIWNYCKRDVELRTLIGERRADYDEERLDTAEDVIMYAMQRKEHDIRSALKAAFFVLVRKGHLRNYREPSAQETAFLSAFGFFEAAMSQEAKDKKVVAFDAPKSQPPAA